MEKSFGEIRKYQGVSRLAKVKYPAELCHVLFEEHFLSTSKKTLMKNAAFIKVLLSGVLVIVLPAIIFAQLEFGFGAGPNFSSMRNIYNTKSGSFDAGFRMGIPVKLVVSNHFKLKSGFYFNKKESSLNGFQSGSEKITRQYKVYNWDMDFHVEYYWKNEIWTVAAYQGLTMIHTIGARYYDGKIHRHGMDFDEINFREATLDFLSGINVFRRFSDSSQIGIDIATSIGLVPVGRTGSQQFRSIVAGIYLLFNL